MDKSIFLEPIFQETFVEMVKFEYYRIIDISRYTNQHTHTHTQYIKHTIIIYKQNKFTAFTIET